MEKKTIICTLVEYADFRLVSWVDGDQVAFKNAEDGFSVLKTEKATLTESSKSTDAGLTVRQELDVLATMDNALAKQFERVPHIYRLTTNKGTVHVLGDTTKKVRPISLIRNFNETRFKAERYTVEHEF